MDYAIGLALLGALIALDNAMWGQFMIAQPLVSGSLFGLIAGDVQSGILVGATVQLLWIGVLPVGAFIPSDHSVTGSLTVILALFLVKAAALSLGEATVLALAASIPAGYLSGKLDILVRQLNSEWNGPVERALEKSSGKPIVWAAWAGLGAAFLRNFLIYILWLTVGAVLLAAMAKGLSPAVRHALEMVFWMLPAVALAVVIEAVMKERLLWWVMGAMTVSLPLALLFFHHLFALLIIVMVMATAVAVRRRTW